MSQTTQSKPGRRLQKKTAAGKAGLSIGAKWAIAAVCAATVLFAGYTALCSWAGEAKIPENTSISISGLSQPIDISGTDLEEAAGLLDEALQNGLQRNVVVNCGGTNTVIRGDAFTVDQKALMEEIEGAAGTVAFFSRGLKMLMPQEEPEPTTYELIYQFRDEEAVRQQLDGLAYQVNKTPDDPTYTIGEEQIEVTTGTPGASMDVDAALSEVLDAYQNGRETVSLNLESIPAQTLSAEKLNEEVYVAPAPVSRKSDGTTVPPVIGVSIDVDAAQQTINSAAAGETLTIPLVYTQPDYSQANESGLLYQDLLSECVTSIGGSEARLGNVKLAAQKCNDTILYPGETFNYNSTVGRRTAEAGFKPAPAYVAGETVNEYGGGICQVSSSIYYCAVYANLKIVTRSNHRYAVGYVPDGLDATVSWGGPEFKFRNDSNYPIKIVCYTSGRTLTVQFYGSNPDGIYVKTERNRLATYNYTTVYKPDASVPVGSTRQSSSPHTGNKTEVYRCVYNANGTLISRTLENVSRYSSSDRVILYNPAEAGKYGGEPAAPSEEPVESTQPTETPEENQDPAAPSESASPGPIESTPPIESTAPIEPAPIEPITPVEPITPTEPAPSSEPSPSPSPTPSPEPPAPSEEPAPSEAPVPEPPSEPAPDIGVIPID